MVLLALGSRLLVQLLSIRWWKKTSHQSIITSAPQSQWIAMVPSPFSERGSLN